MKKSRIRPYVIWATNCPKKKKKKNLHLRLIEGFKKPVNWSAPFRKVFLFRKDSKKVNYIIKSTGLSSDILKRH